MKFHNLQKLPIKVKIAIVIFCDLLISIFATYCAFLIRFESIMLPNSDQILVFFLSISIFLPLFFFLKVYKTAIQYDDLIIFINYLKSFFLYALLFTSVVYFFLPIGRTENFLNVYNGIPISIPLIQSIIFFLIFFLIRIIAKILIYQNGPKNKNFNYLIYGVEKSSAELFNLLLSRRYNVIGFLESYPTLIGTKFYGNYVYDLKNVREIIKKYNVTDIIIAKSSISKTERNKIAKELIKYKVKVRVLPDLSDIIVGNVSINETKEINPIHLLDRKVRNYNSELLQKTITHKNILVTGGGGSIGSEIVRKIINENPSKVVIVDHSEIALYRIKEEIELISKNNKYTFDLQCLLGDINDYQFIDYVINNNNIDSIYHSAAYKHVPIIQENIYAGLKNNVFGSLNLVKVALNSSIKNFTLISSDKAVKPTNIMGATKRIAEQIVQSAFFSNLNKNNIKFSLVRFGNVLDSSGSVIPLFREQIKNGGPITLTDYDVTRYFMTIPEAAELVLQASGLSKGGEIFVLNMGPPIRILDLAKKCIEQSGLQVKDQNNSNGDIEIRIIGLRPGEKLHEELLIGKNPKGTEHPDIIHAFEDFLPFDNLISKLNDLEECLKMNQYNKINLILENLVEGYEVKDSLLN